MFKSKNRKINRYESRKSKLISNRRRSVLGSRQSFFFAIYILNKRNMSLSEHPRQLVFSLFSIFSFLSYLLFKPVLTPAATKIRRKVWENEGRGCINIRNAIKILDELPYFACKFSGNFPNNNSGKFAAPIGVKVSYSILRDKLWLSV